MAQYSDLEITLSKRAAGCYAASFRLNSPGDAAEKSFTSDEALVIDTAEIQRKTGANYGVALTSAFFSEPVKTAFLTALAGSQEALRVRISLEPSAADLHTLRWELLNHPRDPEAPLFMGENVVCSRYLTSSSDWKPVVLRPKAALTALVVAANPAYLSSDRYDDETQNQLAPVDAKGEVQRIRAALQGLEVHELSGDIDPAQPATLNNIAEHLRKGVDILYLVCHGALQRNVPILYLEGDRPVEGKEFVQRIRELEQRPRLIVVSSCQSAGQSGTALSALGPMLAEAGVPAVIAMQGKVSMTMIERFMPCFFRELVKDGQIDRAMSVARGEVRDSRADYWMPALYLRLRDGRIWYQPGFESAQDEFEQWDSLCRSVRSKRCVPILGPDVTEHILGTTAEMASKLAGDVFPFEAHQRHDLAKVTQFLTTQVSEQDARDAVREALSASLVASATRILGRRVEASEAAKDVAAALSNSPDDPMRIAASLDARVYLNSSGSELLYHFLRNTRLESGGNKEPQEITVNWRDETLDAQKEWAALKPTIEKPIVYNVFGKVPEDEFDDTNAESWVLTEDDFFDYAIRTSLFGLMPDVVNSAMMTGSLLFLGFPLDDWKFRILFRLILAKGGSAKLRKAKHVAVQVDPGETTVANAHRARKYMEKYFGDESNVSIYWGTAADFLRDLDRQLKSAKVAANV